MLGASATPSATQLYYSSAMGSKQQARIAGSADSTSDSTPDETVEPK
jgi:hypothetical protein